MDSERISYALGPDDGEAFWGFGSLWTVKASGAQTGGRYALIEETSPAGAGTPLHVHRDDDEAFYVLEGEMTFYLDSRDPIRGTPGTFVHVPGGSVHAFEVTSETARYLIITTPHHEQFYRTAFGAPAKARTLPPDAPIDMERLGPICEDFGVELVEPSSDGESQESRVTPR